MGYNASIKITESDLSITITTILKGYKMKSMPTQEKIIFGNRSFVSSLQTIATIPSGQSIEVKWSVDSGPVTIGNRILSLINVN